MRYGRPVKGRIVDAINVPSPLPSWAEDDAAFLAQMFKDLTGWVPISDDIGNGAVQQQDGSFKQPQIPEPEPKPNNPGNPYFGKPPLETKDFYGLVGQVLSASRFKRLTTDSHFLWVGKVLDHVEHVDPDDKAGQFLQIIAYLQATDGDDAAKLITAQEVAGIMGAWPV